MVVAYVVPATFGPALLRILGASPFRLLVLQRAAAAAIDLVVAAAAAIAAAAVVPTVGASSDSFETSSFSSSCQALVCFCPFYQPRRRRQRQG